MMDTLRPGLTITAPKDAVCGLYPNAPAVWNFMTAIDPEKAIAPTSVTVEGESSIYYYKGLELEFYHCIATMAGYNKLCKMILCTKEKLDAGFLVEMQMEKLAGGGYEAGHTTYNTQEFNDAQLISHKDAWGAAYADLFRTPQFLRDRNAYGRHQQTTNEELMDFIRKLDAENQHMHVFSLGKSPKYGYDIPLVLFTREDVAGKTLEEAAAIIRKNGKPTVQYNAQCHSSEPASTEGALAMMLQLCGSFGKEVLEDLDIYMIPRINMDGAFEVKRVSPTTGEDMNRDYLRVHNQEVGIIISAFNLFQPEVAIDGHEKRSNALTTAEALCTDMELQVGAGALNHPAEMTALAMKMALVALDNGRKLGLRGHFYDKLASAAGGSAGSSYFGTRNSLSFLIETPGQIFLGMSFMERRVISQYIPASSIIRYTAKNSREILDTVHSSRNMMVKTGAVYDPNRLFVLEHDKEETGAWVTPMIHVPTGRVTDAHCSTPYKEHTIALATRVRPTAYLLPQNLPNQEEILRVADIHGIGHYTLPAGSKISLYRYLQQDDQIQLSEEALFCFDEGALVFPNAVNSAVLSVIMEPDFNKVSGRKMTLLSMGLVEADENGCLPIYRYCHDLTDGKVAIAR